MHKVAENGLLVTLQEIALDAKYPENQLWALKVLLAITRSSTLYQHMICDSMGIRKTAECLTRSRDERVINEARQLLELLANTSKEHQEQVYCAFIGTLPYPEAKAQQNALQAIYRLQSLRSSVHPKLIDFCFKILANRYLEVQCAVAQLICLLITYADVRKEVLQGLVKLLRPKGDIQLRRKNRAEPKTEHKESLLLSPSSLQASMVRIPRLNILLDVSLTVHKSIAATTGRSCLRISPGEPIARDPNGGMSAVPISKLVTKKNDSEVRRSDYIAARLAEQAMEVDIPPEFNQQANACLCILTLCQEQPDCAPDLIELNLIPNLVYALGNMENEESQRIAALALKHFCGRFESVSTAIKQTLGLHLYEQLMVNTEHFYFRLTEFEADLMLSNKVVVGRGKANRWT
ncbi:hypothetical protein Ciccas_003239 [Cichlidogyrus casuarinus]|uniref:Uncharacterized protein n=1 Tax=Cichlidogyrus casuarinus TaxID=1844966 RepID=A0ABD2QEZ1_9PLAT